MPNRIDEISMLIEMLDPGNWSFEQLLADYYLDADVDDNRRVMGIPHNLPLLQQRLRETIMVRTTKAEALKHLPPMTDRTEAPSQCRPNLKPARISRHTFMVQKLPRISASIPRLTKKKSAAAGGNKAAKLN